MIEAERIKDLITNKIQYKDAYENFYAIFFKCVRKSLIDKLSYLYFIKIKKKGRKAAKTSCIESQSKQGS